MDIKKSVFSLATYNNGYFKSEKQAKFLIDKLNQVDGYLGSSDMYGNSVTFFAYWDEKGITKIESHAQKSHNIKNLFIRKEEGVLNDLQLKKIKKYERELRSLEKKFKERQEYFDSGQYNGDAELFYNSQNNIKKQIEGYKEAIADIQNWSYDKQIEKQQEQKKRQDEFKKAKSYLEYLNNRKKELGESSLTKPFVVDGSKQEIQGAIDIVKRRSSNSTLEQLENALENYDEYKDIYRKIDAFHKIHISDDEISYEKLPDDIKKDFQNFKANIETSQIKESKKRTIYGKATNMAKAKKISLSELKRMVKDIMNEGKVASELISFADMHGLRVLPVNFKHAAAGVASKRKGFDLVNAENQIQITIEPKDYPKGSSMEQDRWMIKDKTKGEVHYAQSLSQLPKLLADFSPESHTGHRRIQELKATVSNISKKLDEVRKSQ